MLKIEGGLINLLQISQLEDLNDTSISEKNFPSGGKMITKILIHNRGQ